MVPTVSHNGSVHSANGVYMNQHQSSQSRPVGCCLILAVWGEISISVSLPQLSSSDWDPLPSSLPQGWCTEQNSATPLHHVNSPGIARMEAQTGPPSPAFTTTDSTGITVPSLAIIQIFSTGPRCGLRWSACITGCFVLRLLWIWYANMIRPFRSTRGSSLSSEHCCATTILTLNGLLDTIFYNFSSFVVLLFLDVTSCALASLYCRTKAYSVVNGDVHLR